MIFCAPAPHTWGRIKRTYIRHTLDRSIPLALQDRVIREADALTPHNRFDVRTVRTTHAATGRTGSPAAPRRRLGYVIRVAALVELCLRGKVTDVGGKVHVTDDAGTGDPVLDQVLGEIARDRHRKWVHWVRRHARDTLNAVEWQLVSSGAITVRKRTLLADRVTAVAAASIGQLRQRILQTLRGDQPIDTLDPYDAALTALAANGELSRTVPHKERKAHKDRVAALTAHLGASAPALKNVVDELNWLRWSSPGPRSARPMHVDPHESAGAPGGGGRHF